MRILHVVPTYIPAFRYGGPIHSVHGLCRALAARGHEVEVATTNVDGPGNSDVPLGSAVDLDGVKVFYFASRRLRRLYYAPSMHRFMKANMSRWDLVHVHSVFLWPTSAAAQLARAARRPYVVSPRGMLVADLIAQRSSMLKRAWIRLFERRNLEHASAVHVTSAIEAQELLALGLRTKRIFEVPNGVDDAATPADAPPPFPGRYALFLGRISWKKGLDRLIEAMARVPEATLVAAGNDDEGYWPRMAELAKSLGIEHRVRRVGYVEGAEKASLIRGAACFVLPSRSENFGNSVLEAMACGVPVVVTPEVGLAEVVRATRSGLVESGEPEKLAAAIASLMGDPALAAQLGANARRTAAEYAWPRIAERMEREYRACVAP